jgi:hypothetical protein
MRISELLQSMASWLEDPNNEAILLSEYNDDCLKIVASACIEAAANIKKAAEQVEAIEPQQVSQLDAESIENLAELATAFDFSGDESLKKQAAVIDELLLTIAAPKNYITDKQAADDTRLEDLKKKYNAPKERLEELNHIEAARKGIEKSEMTKTYRILEQPLSTRYCPDHPGGVQLQRIGDHVFQCELDKKSYDFENGYTLQDGTRVPGGSVQEQGKNINTTYQSLFDSRSERLQSLRF